MTPSLHRILAIKLALILLLMAPFGVARAQDDTPQPPKFLPPTQDIATATANAMTGIRPTGSAPRAGINKNGVYTLTGDLFKNSKMAALIDGTDEVIVANWTGREWEPTGYINVETDWKFPGWDDAAGRGREPAATKPFWMISLQGTPLLVIASFVEKEGQDYSAILLDRSGGKISDSTDSFASAPSVHGKYLVTTDGSRVKAETFIYFFSKIEGGKLLTAASWENREPFSQPENGGEYECEVATTGTDSYTLMQDYSGAKPPADIVIYKGDYSDDWESIANAWKEHPAYAKIYLTLKNSGRKSDLASDDTSSAFLEAYIFMKLLNLPRDFYSIVGQFTGEISPESPVKSIESEANFRVTGDPAAVKLLTPKR
jgi:hypothetical protein